MTTKDFFVGFEIGIRRAFQRAIVDAALSTEAELELATEPTELHQARAEFCVRAPNGPVRVTWGGLRAYGRSLRVQHV
jgi:hypothetical protein